MDFKNMTDSELASVMVSYISRVAHLRDLVGRYLEGSDRGSIPADRIRDLYKQIKDELRDDAHYLDLVKNRNGSNVYMHYFTPSIKEASAWGFNVPSNRAITQQFFGAVADAHYKLTKYYSLQEWERLI